MSTKKKPVELAHSTGRNFNELVAVNKNSIGKSHKSQALFHDSTLNNSESGLSETSSCGQTGVVKPGVDGNDRPTYTNRWVGTGKPCVFGKLGNLVGVGYDWLSLTTSERMSYYLLINSELVITFGGQQGFRSTQKRKCFGGTCKRRNNPVATSKRFGLDYESWIWSSSVSDHWARELSQKKDFDCYPTCIDVAFDFQCHPDFFPSDFLDPYRKYIEKRGFNIYSEGHEIQGTRYIGNYKNSPVYLRIYRKDLQDKLFGKKYGSVMRLELGLQNGTGHLQGIWNGLVDRGYEYSLRYASGVIFGLSNYCCIGWSDVDFPPPLKKNNDDHEKKLLYFIKQNSSRFCNYRSHGIDLNKLFDAQCDNMSSSSKSRKQQDYDALSDVNPDDLTDSVLQLISGDSVVSPGQFQDAVDVSAAVDEFDGGLVPVDNKFYRAKSKFYDESGENNV